MAPGAHIIYVGAQDCFDKSLLAALSTPRSPAARPWSPTRGVTPSATCWTTPAQDRVRRHLPARGRHRRQRPFSTGDNGDNFAISGLTAPDYPATSPFITAVGGTTLDDRQGARLAEYGWSTGQAAPLRAPYPKNCGSATAPVGSLAFNAGGGGGTSYSYLQPSYQAPVVPSALALRNENLFGPVPLRVEPDISMDADAPTGMLIGLTQTFPDGTYTTSSRKAEPASPRRCSLVSSPTPTRRREAVGSSTR